ncbi:MAG TPA: acyltransferase [Gemmatimonadaceae bacterium]|jgi:acetyltransferase-like isoleucine patch superfamily enzyme|nr:acyltransferase [Gemmatimonadaceae bacterium]
MALLSIPFTLLADAKLRAARSILRLRLRVRHPSLRCDPTAILDYPFGRLDAFSLGVGVRIMPFCEIVVIPSSRFSATEGRLVLGDDVVIAAGANIRAAGGVIRIGNGSGVGQYSVLVAANHQLVLGEPYFKLPWDEDKTGVEIGANVWIGAHCVLLPGTRVGDHSVVAAGSVVNGAIPAGELWGGVPARRLKAIPTRESLERALGAAQTS